MPWWLHTVLGLASAGLLGAAAWRLASRLSSADPVLRVLAAAVWWWLGAQCGGLLTGVAPGGLAPTAFVGALLPAAVVLRLVPRGAPAARPDRAQAALLGTAGAGTLVLALLVLARPALGLDGLLYHLALPSAWVAEGRLAGLPHVTGIPVEAYPVGVELASGWLAVLTGSTAAVVLVPAAALGLTVLAVWTLTRRLGGSVAAAWGAVATTALATPFAVEGAQLSTDLPAAALVACGAALVVAGARRDGAGVDPAGDPVALLTGLCGILLAIGIKTSSACGGLVFLLVAWPVRRELLGRLRTRPAWGLLVGLAVLCGGVWLARNLVLHGHPSWPLLASASGDPVPAPLAPFTGRFVDDPLEALRVGGGGYLRLAWPVVPLVLVSLLALRRRGPVRAVAIAGVLGAVAWAFAPATGIFADADLLAGATRYLMPCWTLLAAAAWSLAPDAPGRAATGRLVAALGAGVALAQLVVLWTQPGARTAVALDRLPIEQAFWAALAGAAVLAALRLRPGALGFGRAAPAAGAALRPAGAVRPAGMGPPAGAAPSPVASALDRARAVPPGRAAAGAAVLLALVLLLATPGFPGRHGRAVGTGTPPGEPSDVVLALASAPAWALGAHARPGAVVVDSCGPVLAGFRAGRTVTLGPSVPAAQRCGLPGAPSAVVDGYRVWAP